MGPASLPVVVVNNSDDNDEHQRPQVHEESQEDPRTRGLSFQDSCLEQVEPEREATVATRAPSDIYQDRELMLENDIREPFQNNRGGRRRKPPRRKRCHRQCHQASLHYQNHN